MDRNWYPSQTTVGTGLTASRKPIQTIPSKLKERLRVQTHAKRRKEREKKKKKKEKKKKKKGERFTDL